MYVLKLFGGASLDGPDGPVAGRATQRHRLALLAVISTAGTGGISRDKLIALLWPEHDTDRARHLLSNSLYIVRQALGEAALPSSTDVVRIDPTRLRCDVREFEEALARGALARAVALHAGPFLDGFFLPENPEFDHWLERERGRLSDAYRRALEALAEAAAGERDFRGAAGWWMTRAALDPLDSSVALRLVRALEASGNRAAALRQGAVHQRLLRDELGLEAAPELTTLLERLRAEPIAASRAPADVASAGPAEAVPTLPAAGPGPAPPADAPASAPSDVTGVAVPVAVPVAARRRGWRRPVAAALLVVVALASAAWSLRAREEPERSIVVLPFVDMSADGSHDYFADGLTEEITARLSAVSGLKVISRTSAMSYAGKGRPLRQIADELDVAHVLEGSVRADGGRLRISTQLIDATADRHRWSHRYDRELRDVLGVQEEIALEVVRALRIELGARERGQLAREGTRDPAAYELYRRGRDLWSTRTKEGHERAIAYYRQAIARDSTYADAWAALAAAHMTALQHNVASVPEAELYARTRAAAERALALDDESADAHAVQGTVLMWRRDWPGAERELRRARELNPGGQRGWYALLLSGMGRTDEALREIRRSREVDPLVPVTHTTLGRLCYLARDHACAVEAYRKALAMNSFLAQAHQGLGLAYAQQGLTAEALRSLARAAELDPAFLPDLAYGLAMTGNRQAALDTLARAKRSPFEPFWVARAYVALDEPDSAFAWLERSSWHWPHRAVRGDPALDPLRADPRFAALSARVERELGLRRP